MVNVKFVAPIFAAACTCLLPAVLGCVRKQPTDFESELAGIDHDISTLEHDAASNRPADAFDLTRHVNLLYRRASLKEDPGDNEAAESGMAAAMQRIGLTDDLCLLKANLDLKLHRLDEAKANLAKLSSRSDNPLVIALSADIAFQEGRYRDAAIGYEKAVQKNRTWDNLSRLAFLRAQFGEFEKAENLYVEAQDEITAKEMRAWAWVELQKGLLDFHRGRYDEVLDHYELAARAYSGYWLIEEHIAELFAARRRFNRAIALYRQVICRSPKPEFQQALGDIYLARGDPNRAEIWHDRALSGYLESARRGEVHYFHHLADFYLEVRNDGAEALKWAREDFQLRSGAGARQTLAWALYRSGRPSEALREIQTTLATGVRNADLLSQAAAIHQAGGHAEAADNLLAEAARINPQIQPASAEE